MFRHLAIPTLFALAAFAAAAQSNQSDSVPVRLVVTAEAHRGKTPPPVRREDVIVYQDKDRARVTDWVPLTGNRSALQLWILIDDGEDTSFGTQISELKKFITAQPGSTQIGVAYLRNGSVSVAHELSADHQAVAKSVRLPLGNYGISASPYLSLSDLVKKWPATDGRREVLIITSGIDLFYGPGPDNPYLTSSIRDAQRANVIVNSIYYGGSGHWGHSFWGINWGQNYLSQLGDETGGEAYWQGNLNPVSIGPYLDDFTQRLQNQYLLTFVAQGGKKAGLEPVKLRTELNGVQLLAADRVYVPQR